MFNINKYLLKNIYESIIYDIKEEITKIETFFDLENILKEKIKIDNDKFKQLEKDGIIDLSKLSEKFYILTDLIKINLTTVENSEKYAISILCCNDNIENIIDDILNNKETLKFDDQCKYSGIGLFSLEPEPYFKTEEPSRFLSGIYNCIKNNT